jgi:hypothetical protein
MLRGSNTSVKLPQAEPTEAQALDGRTSHWCAPTTTRRGQETSGRRPVEAQDVVLGRGDQRHRFDRHAVPSERDRAGDVDVGGGHDALTQRLGATVLGTNHRFHDPVYRDAAQLLRDRQPAGALELLASKARCPAGPPTACGYGTHDGTHSPRSKAQPSASPTPREATATTHSSWPPGASADASKQAR